MNPNIRKPEESQSAFRVRRQREVKLAKIFARGRVIWNNGTYVRAKHGEIGRSMSDL